MVSSTPCCTKAPTPAPEAARRCWHRHWHWHWHAPTWRGGLQRAAALLAVGALVAGLGLPGAAGRAHAQEAGSASGLRLELGDPGLYLNAQLHFTLPLPVEDALYKGIPMYFVLDAQVARERWYWTDRQVAQAARYLRLSYQPLTRRWRLSTAAEPLERSGLGVVLGQNFDALGEALEAMQRVARWKIAEPGTVTPGMAYSVRLAFRLDTSQLARPFQIGTLGSNSWSLALEHRARTVVEPLP